MSKPTRLVRVASLTRQFGPAACMDGDEVMGEWPLPPSGCGRVWWSYFSVLA